LCQWEDEIEGKYTHVCFNRTRGDVYCYPHNRKLERESKRREREREIEARAAPARPSAPRVSRRRDTSNRNTSNWPAFKPKHPERVAFYASSTWRSMRDRQLKAYPTCAVCGVRASDVDHVISIALGGSQDGQLRSLCAKHHHEKTVRDSHQAAKRRR
jgi:5-methylcytosine-specific restriction endonuclease McrA